MKAILFSLLLTVGALGSPRISADPAWNGSVYTDIRKATYALVSKTTPNSIFCSAIQIAKDRLITAAHCVNGAQLLFVKEHHLSKVVYPVRNVISSLTHDLAILIVDGLPNNAIALATELPAVDSDIVTVGYPLGAMEIATQGKVNGFVVVQVDIDEEGNPIIRKFWSTSAPVAGGNSGGGTFFQKDGKWFLAGTLVAVLAESSGFGQDRVRHLALNEPLDEMKRLNNSVK